MVADGVWPELRRVPGADLPAASELPAFDASGVATAARLPYGIDVDSAKPVEDVAALAAAGRPLLLVHEGADRDTGAAERSGGGRRAGGDLYGGGRTARPGPRHPSRGVPAAPARLPRGGDRHAGGTVSGDEALAEVGGLGRKRANEQDPPLRRFALLEAPGPVGLVANAAAPWASFWRSCGVAPAGRRLNPGQVTIPATTSLGSPQRGWERRQEGSRSSSVIVDCHGVRMIGGGGRSGAESSRGHCPVGIARRAPAATDDGPPGLRAERAGTSERPECLSVWPMQCRSTALPCPRLEPG